jgi:hypothetical protein
MVLGIVLQRFPGILSQISQQISSDHSLITQFFDLLMDL